MFSRKKAIKQLESLKKDVNKMRLAAEGWPTSFQTLISIILSARTRDETTIQICKKLFEKFPTAESLSKASVKEVEETIKPVNFFQNKSKNIIECSKKISTEFNSKIPKSINKLITLPGVGRKTANVFLSEYGNDAIGVDTHVEYISNYLGWVDTNKPEKIERILKEIFPKEKWSEVNPTLVRFGKTHISRIKKNKILDEIHKTK
ncbi:endonuclease III [Candidatus Pacearchaeota archaeon CG10_big_fil_rev_8_21_14_0_10_32_42]|nr:MAG: endonuclease III [Candidatus Pacearchaeota archaeon CG10_big_fil_rev_8_21_14_0_10_32_42]